MLEEHRGQQNGSRKKEMIPPELYEVVAEILVFVDAVDHRMVKESVANGGKHKG